jgi:hypothetical protein
MRTKHLSLATMLTATLTLGLAGTALAESPVVELTFEKSVVELGSWEGTVGGDETGTIMTTLTSLGSNTSSLLVSFDWQVGLDSGERIAAEVNGFINLHTGRVVMSGEVIAGYLAGSRIQVLAWLDLTDSSSAGTMRITP